MLKKALGLSGINLTYSENPAVVWKPETLTRFDAVLMYGNWEQRGKMPPDQLRALLDFVEGGGGFLPIHCASACYGASPEFVRLVGARFQSHGDGVFEVRNVKPQHPILKNLDGLRSRRCDLHQRQRDDLPQGQRRRPAPAPRPRPAGVAGCGTLASEPALAPPRPAAVGGIRRLLAGCRARRVGGRRQPAGGGTRVPLAAELAALAQHATGKGNASAQEIVRKFTPDEAVHARSKEVYSLTCIACHGMDGKGVPETFPPLDGAGRVIGKPESLIKVVLHGLIGPLEVNGVKYNGAMPPLGPALNDQQVADALTHIRQIWTNDAAAVTPEEVAKVRAAHPGRLQMWTVKELE